jgi:hypothetical protein
MSTARNTYNIKYVVWSCLKTFEHQILCAFSAKRKSVTLYVRMYGCMDVCTYVRILVCTYIHT